MTLSRGGGPTSIIAKLREDGGASLRNLGEIGAGSEGWLADELISKGSDVTSEGRIASLDANRKRTQA